MTQSNHRHVNVIENWKVKNSLFSGLAFVYLVLFVVNDWVNYVDECLVSYALVFALCLINVTLLGWYWWVTGKATAVYRWVVVLQAGVGFTNAVNFGNRYRMLCGDTDFLLASKWASHTDYWVWKYRLLPETLAIIYLLALIVARLCCSTLSEEE